MSVNLRRTAMGLRFVLSLTVLVAFVGLSACGDDGGGDSTNNGIVDPNNGNNNGNNNNDTGGLCDEVTCEQPEDYCDGDTAVTYSGAGACDAEDGTCDFSEVEASTDCTEGDQVCQAGECVDEAVDLCAEADCSQPDDYCEDDTAVTYSGDGTCDESDGSCDFAGVETQTDCTESDQICQDGACVEDTGDLCIDVSCDQPDDYCDGDTAVTYSGDGTCDGSDGTCDFSGVETQTDCTTNGEVCDAGACVEDTGDQCTANSCEQPDDFCDGDTAVTYSGDGTCNSGDGSCDFTAVEDRTNCLLSNESCVDGTCQTPDTAPTPGDLVITEVMQDPSEVTDANGEWFEVYNTTSRTLHLNGLEIHDAGSDTFTVTDPNGDPIELGASEFFVFGKNADSGTNGGVTVDYDYGSSMSLANSDDEVIIMNGSDEIDRVEWDDGATFPDPTGASMQFGTENDILSDDNNDGSLWCESRDPIDSSASSSDLGSPGGGNVQCSLPSATVTIYELQDDTEANHPQVGQPVSVSGVVVTAVSGDDAWVQETGGGEYSGAYVELSNVSATIAVGDTVDVEGTYTEASDVTTIEATSIAVTSSGSPLSPESVASGDIGEPWEGVLVQVEEPAVTDENPDSGIPDDFGEFRIDANVRVDDLLFDYDGTQGNPTNCDHFDSLAGVVHYSFGDFKILPRDGADFGTLTILSSSGTTRSVDIQGFAFSPAVVCVDSGAAVTWTNSDAAPHTVTQRDPITDGQASAGFDSGTINSSDTFDLTFNNPGTYPYLCNFHTGMLGRVIVLE